MLIMSIPRHECFAKTYFEHTVIAPKMLGLGSFVKGDGRDSSRKCMIEHILEDPYSLSHKSRPGWNIRSDIVR